MTLFWLIFTAMILVALAAVAPALLRYRSAPAEGQDTETETNLAVYRERLDELKRYLDEGEFTSAEYEDAVAELERELLQEVPAEQGGSGTDQSAGGRRGTLAGLAVAMPVVAVFVYLLVGSPGLVAEPPATRMGSQEAKRFASMPPADRIPALEDLLEERPKTPTALILLGRAYHSQERYGEAVEAFGRAHELAGDEPQLLAHYAESMVMANGKQFTDRADQLVDRALELDPANSLALWLAGSSAMSDGKKAEAATHWRKLAGQMQPGSQGRRMLKGYIAQAEGVSPDEVTLQGDKAGPEAGPRFTVNVSLDPALAEQAEPGDMVFIFARAAQGPPMPVAAVRKRVKDLPASVTLSDARAMMPSRTLSQQDKVVVGARVSKSGRPMAQSGDLQGLTNPVPVDGDRTLEVTIDQQVP
jgi:cytochrome c-type biogenesis protein CcmH